MTARATSLAENDHQVMIAPISHCSIVTAAEESVSHYWCAVMRRS